MASQNVNSPPVNATCFSSHGPRQFQPRWPGHGGDGPLFQFLANGRDPISKIGSVILGRLQIIQHQLADLQQRLLSRVPFGYVLIAELSGKLFDFFDQLHFVLLRPDHASVGRQRRWQQGDRKDTGSKQGNGFTRHRGRLMRFFNRGRRPTPQTMADSDTAF